MTSAEIVKVLEGYRQEATEARKNGPNPRDAAWEDHLDQYWGRYDFSRKAPWQNRQFMPEFQVSVDRFVAALTRALTTTDKWFSIEDARDTERDLSQALERMMGVWLKRVGRLPTGQPTGFASTFSDVMWLGAVMQCAWVVVWRTPPDGGAGYVSVEPLDPRKVWVDPTGRGLYRVRRYEIDRHDLPAMKGKRDGNGAAIYNLDELAMLEASIQAKDAMTLGAGPRLAGHSTTVNSNRKEITVDEYRATILTADGQVYMRNALVLVANERWLIRGPEKNPYWHQQDWVGTSPLITVPMSQYGRSYMETVARLSKAFVELTNLILDGVMTSTLNAFAAVPEMLSDPTQLDEGLYPNVTFLLEQGIPADQFMTKIELGRLPGEAITIWQALKGELREGVRQNEMSTGQFAPNSRTSATEVNSVEGNSSAMLEAVARTVEERVLEPMLELVWKTGLQHLTADDTEMAEVVGPELFQALVVNKEELATRRVTFRARALTGLIAKSTKLKALSQMVQAVLQVPPFAQAFAAKYDLGKVFDYMIGLMDIDTKPFELTPREQAMKRLEAQVQQQMAVAMGGGGEPGQGGPTGAPAPAAPPGQVPGQPAGGM